MCQVGKLPLYFKGLALLCNLLSAVSSSLAVGVAYSNSCHRCLAAAAVAGSKWSLCYKRPSAETHFPITMTVSHLLIILTENRGECVCLWGGSYGEGKALKLSNKK